MRWRIHTIRIGLSAVVLLTASRVASAQDFGAPRCFLQDTIYHVVIDLPAQAIHLQYGSYRLVSCRFEAPGDSSDLADFAHRWRSRSRTAWQSVRTRGVWAGNDAVSDTVVEIVSEIAKVDPDHIRRVLPDRFRVDITGGFQLLGLTAEGAEQKRTFAEAWGDLTSQILSLGKLDVLRIRVSREDAQTLYYALEPGTPVVLVDHSPQ